MPDAPVYDPFAKHFDPKPHRQPDDQSIAQAIERAVQAAHAVIEGIAGERRIAPGDASDLSIDEQILHNRNVGKWERWEKLFVEEAGYDYVDLRRHAARQVHNGADAAELYERHSIEPDEMGEHLDFMAPYVRGEHIIAAAMDARRGLDHSEACGKHGITAEELQDGLTQVLRV